MWGGKIVVFERETLYEQVWKEPPRTVAKSYGVSDVYLGRMCRELGIPLPGRGYWAKLRAGKIPRRLKLPRLKRGQKDRLVSYRRTPAPRRRLELPEGAKLEVAAPIVVTAELTEPHRLVAATARRLAKARPTCGAASGRPLGLLDISVSPASLDRALRIADALLKALLQAGLKVEITGAAETATDLVGPHRSARPRSPHPRLLQRGVDRLLPVGESHTDRGPQARGQTA
jgi:hypothetical protein